MKKLVSYVFAMIAVVGSVADTATFHFPTTYVYTTGTPGSGD